MIKIDIGKIQLIALASVEDPTWTSKFREICRWYSKEFSTPLHYVEYELSPDYVLRHYYESIFLELKNNPEDSAAIRYQNLKDTVMGLTSPEEQDEDDDKWAEEINRQIKEEQEKEEKARKNKENPNINDEMDITVSGE
jgi:hypothetical protein